MGIESISKPIVKYSVNATFASAKANPTFGDQQTCYVEWRLDGKTHYAAFVATNAYDKKEFGLGVHRAGKGELQQEVIAKIDPKGMKLYFVDNEHYRNTDEVKWQEPVKLFQLSIFNKELFEKTYEALEPEVVKPKLSLANTTTQVVDGIGGMINVIGDEYERTVVQSGLSRRQLIVQAVNNEEIWIGTKHFTATGGSEYVDQKYFTVDQINEAIEYGSNLMIWVNAGNWRSNEQTNIEPEAKATGTMDRLKAKIDDLITDFSANVMYMDNPALDKDWVSRFANLMVEFDGDPASESKYKKLAKELITPNGSNDFPLMYSQKILMLNELSGIVKDAEAGSQVKVIDPTSPEGYAKIMTDPALQEQHQDTLDAFFHERILAIRSALRGLGWTGEVGALRRNEFSSAFATKRTASDHIVAIRFPIYKEGDESNYVDTITDDLSKSTTQLAADISMAAKIRNKPAQLVNSILANTLSVVQIVDLGRLAQIDLFEKEAEVDHEY